MNIGFIGCGEVGRCYAEALAQAGHKIIALCDEQPSATLADFAAKLNTEIQPSIGDWIAQADVVINAVFGGAALSVAKQALPLMKKGAVFADFTTADPAHMKEAALAARAVGVRFVDVAIMGAITASKSATPLICAGEGADTIQSLMSSAGSPIKLAGDEAGDAATLKLLRSIFTKGLEALSIECLITAEQKGLRSSLYDVLSDLDQMPLQKFMEMSVCTHVVHAKRRLKEVQEAKHLMQNATLQPLVLNGVESLFQRTSDALAQTTEIDNSLQGGLAWLTTHAQLNHKQS